MAKKENMTSLVAPDSFFSLQGPGPSGKNEEKIQVLTEKIEDLVVQVCTKYGNIVALFVTYHLILIDT